VRILNCVLAVVLAASIGTVWVKHDRWQQDHARPEKYLSAHECADIVSYAFSLDAKSRHTDTSYITCTACHMRSLDDVVLMRLEKIRGEQVIMPPFNEWTTDTPKH